MYRPTPSLSLRIWTPRAERTVMYVPGFSLLATKSSRTMPYFLEASTPGNDRILRRVASTMSFLDLKSLSLVARRYAPITRPRLFHHLGMGIWEEDHSIARCISFLAGDHYLAQCVHAFELHAHYVLPLPTLTLPNGYKLLSLLPDLHRLTITGFTWAIPSLSHTIPYFVTYHWP